MKEWSNNLSLREKQTLSLGSVLVILFLLYEIIWSPFSNKLDNLRSQIQHNRELLTWMQNAEQHMDSLKKSMQSKSTQQNSSLLSIVQSQINKSPLQRHVTQLRQSENDSVEFNLQKADFDQLILVLTDLWKKYNLIVAQMTITPTDVPGEVTADVVIRAAG
ncbi:MAG: type II secretion system protein GspM [Gammaproteobacteria bacterium]